MSYTFNNAHTEDAFDTVDSIFFTGDSLFDRDEISVARNMLERWAARLKDIEDIVSEMEHD